jgi:Type III restriction enzyme, res subunit
MSDNDSYQKLYWDLFVNRDDVYAIQLDNGTYDSIKQKLTPTILFSNQTIGLYQLSLENKVKWAVLDIDINKKIAKDDPKFDFANWNDRLKNQVNEASKLLKSNNVPHYIEFSGFRGYHIWVFFDQPTEAGVVKPWMHHLFSELKQVDENFEWELFPKQEKLAGVGFGSLVKAPLQIHMKSGKATNFVDENFNKIDGLPDIETYTLDPVAVKALTETTKHAPKSFTPTTTTAGVQTKYPVPDNIVKMLANCAQLRDIVEKAEKNNHLENDERVFIANLGRFFGKNGIAWIHSVLQNCRDYNATTTDYHISMLSGNPVYCQTVEKVRANSLCDNCRNKANTPISLGYTRIQQQYFAGLELAKTKKLPDLFTKLGLTMTEKTHSYEVELYKQKYYINKHSGVWLKEFNIIDFIRYARPEDWDLFIHQNYPDINVDKFTFERTEKKIDEIFPFKGSTITFKNYLSEADTEVEQIVTDDDNYNMVAFTGSGKTQAVIKKIQAKKTKAIFLTPYESTAKQLKNNYTVPAIYGTVSIDSVKDYVKTDNLIVSTYDGLRKILETQIIPEEYVLLIDEAHNLITHANFRGFALQTIFENMTRFKKIVHITGTPEGVLNNDYKNIKFVKQNQPKQIANYSIIVSHEKTDTACIDHIIKNRPGRGKVIIFKNSIKSLEVISDSLVQSGVEKRRIKILTAQTKDEKVFESIVSKEVIPPEVKYVLTTCVISDGVNIVNQNIDTVYLLDVENLLQLRQFVARFRRGVTNIYDIIPSPIDVTAGKKWFDFSVELKRFTALYENIARDKTVFLNQCGLIDGAGKTNLLKSAVGTVSLELDFLRVNEDTGEVVVSYPLLTLNLLGNFNRVGFVDSGKRKEYLDHFLNVKCNIEELAAVKVDLTASKAKIKDKADKERVKLIGLLNKDPKIVVTTYLQNVNQSLFNRIKNVITDLYDASISTADFYEKNKPLLKQKDSGWLIEQYLHFYRFGFPHKFIIELLKRSDHEINEFVLGYYTLLNLEMVQNHVKILKYNKKSLQVFDYAVFKFLYDYFQPLQEFTYDDLLHDINTYLLREKITSRKLGRLKLQEIVNRLVTKTRIKKRAGSKVNSVGWKFIGFKTIEDLVGKKNEQIIKDSFLKYLNSKIEFIHTNLFISNLQQGNSSNSAMWKDIMDMRKYLLNLTKTIP